METFTEEFRDRHWKKCRYAEDPRTCGKCYDDKETHTRRICAFDGVDCDARWVE